MNFSAGFKATSHKWVPNSAPGKSMHYERAPRLRRWDGWRPPALRYAMQGFAPLRWLESLCVVGKKCSKA